MSCCDKGGLRSVDDMLAEILAQTGEPPAPETIPLKTALGRVLAEDIVSPVNVPPYNNSAVDGYAVRCADLKGTPLTISQRIPAGAVPETLEPGTAARIFTGATIPEGADAVIMQEDSELVDGRVTLPSTADNQQNIRPLGQDIQQSQLVLTKGHRLRPQDLGLLASIGVAELQVYSPLTVAILSTGDELIEPGHAAEPGQIYNSNRYTLQGLLQSFGYRILDFGIIEDTFEATEAALAKASEEADVIITSGGVSVGEEDHVKAAINALGSLNLWRLAIKPGKPFAFGHVRNTPVIGLPGNPGAVFVTFCILARSWLLKCQGASNYGYQGFSLPLAFNIRKPGKRREYLRARLQTSGGNLQIEQHPNQSSGVLSSASWADGLAIILENEAPQTGDLVEFIPFSELFN